ncbi:PREDICTED: malonate--CoA ligase isoform X1 [Nicotiana attenuata]|uniref:malonate--CoA ligase isoform X1 n=2 Tax=Nicotiana attenuata TaxID=49451 RepID=UPI000904CFB1|nr:PREDICTED: malonate--CoA ligase isoform X1 [Nicotiana attenuata]
MSSFKLLNHFHTLRSSTPLFYSPFRFTLSLRYCFSSHKNPIFRSSQSRLFSSASNISSYMELVKEVASKGPESQENIAIRADEKSYTYLQLISSARRISNLLSNLDLKIGNGIKRNVDLDGARVGIVAKPCAEFVAGILGTWLSGGVAVPLALSYPETELLHVMNDSDISVILSTEDHQDIMNTIAVKTGACLSLIPPIPDVDLSTKHDPPKDVASDGPRNLPEMTNCGEDPAMILYTSGTTGKPKGVVHTHKGILAQIQILAEAWEYTSKDQFLHCLPLHHVHGLFNALLAPLYAGSTVDFMPKFSVRGIWQKWRESYPTDGTKTDNAITVFTGVPTMYTRLIQGYEAMDPELKAASASASRHLRLMMCGSSALPLPVMQQWETITGHRLLERYGMTEFVMAISNPIKGKRKGGTVGKPFTGVQAKILLDDESGSDKTGVGELCIRSPSLFKEYWRLPEVTKQSFTDDGFFKTGDAVTVDEDGYYIILGRTNADIMKVGGYKLSALEIEAVLLEHPAISECCVLGLPDKDYGEVVCAIVIPDTELKRKRDEELKPALSLQELSDWAKERLAPYKIPSRLFVWDSLPRNAMGKVNKKELKRKLADDPK